MIGTNPLARASRATAILAATALTVALLPTGTGATTPAGSFARPPIRESSHARKQFFTATTPPGEAVPNGPARDESAGIATIRSAQTSSVQGPPDLIADWTANGINASGWGNAVATAGDVNGDGYSDLIVGAPYYSSGQSQEGLVQIFFGTANGPQPLSGWSYQSDLTGAQLGWSVAPAGDVNGDGFDDFVVGAPGVSNGHTGEGRVYVFAGSAGLPALLTTFELNEAGARFGHTVAWAGDVNGDGYDEVLAGAPEWGGFGSPFFIPVQGAAALYYGSASGPVDSGAWKPKGGQEDGDYGYSVAGVGDVNHDGYHDVVVGQPRFDPGATDSNHGKAYLYLGSASGLTTSASWTVTGTASDQRLGTVVAYAGDCNSDDLADVLVAVPGYTTTNGVFRFFRGHEVNLLIATSYHFGNTDEHATSLAGIGDYDGDGRCDVISGGGADDDVIVWTGGDGLFPTNAGKIDGTGSFGTALASAGDTNGDGLSDWVISDPSYSGGLGRLYVYLGQANYSADTTPDGSRFGSEPGALLGGAVASAGDVNGDRDDDLLIGAPGGGAAGGGQAQYWGGSNFLPPGPAWSYDSPNPGGRLGEAVAPAGDVNGDGFADIVVGEPGMDAVHVFHGGASVSSTPDWSYTHPQSGCDFGAAVDGAGDVNGDGYADIVIGAPLYDSSLVDQGQICVFLGSPSGLGSTPVCRTGDEAGMRLGAAVAGVGDGNGDGYDDVAAGAPNLGVGLEESRGGLFVYGGGAEGLGSVLATAVGPVWGDYLGRSVAGAGDVNGDGLADLIVGLPGRDGPVNSSVGEAWVLLGAAGQAPYVTTYVLPPPTVLGGEELGRSVACAGDPSGRGSTDVVVASKDYATGEGRIDYFGLRSGSMVRLRHRLTGYPATGIRVASAGDFDGDGLPEEVVGGPAATLGGEGAFWLFSAHALEGDHVPARLPGLKTMTSTPIPLRGRLTDGDDLLIQMNGWFPNGHARMRLEWQLAATGQPYGETFETIWVPSNLFSGWGILPFEVPHPQSLTEGERYRWRVRVASSVPFHPKGRWTTHAPNSSSLYGFTVATPTVSIDDPFAVHGNAALLAAPFPNPSSRGATIRFHLPAQGDAELLIVDVAGRIVRTLHRGGLPGGAHEFHWNGRNRGGAAVTAGSYFAVLDVNGRREARRLVLLDAAR